MISDFRAALEMRLIYEAMRARFGELDLGEFAVLYREAEAFMDAARLNGYRPDEVADLFSRLNPLE